MSPRLAAGELSAADRQLLEIVRAIIARPTVLLLDEATSALDASGVDVALDLMRRAAADGCAVLFVTHRLSEVFRVADRITVLRDGQWRGTQAASAVDQDGLVEQMAGRSVNVEFPDRADPSRSATPILAAGGLTGSGYGPIDLEVGRGEIVGIAGADGNGQLALLGGLAAIGDPGAGSRSTAPGSGPSARPSTPASPTSPATAAASRSSRPSRSGKTSSSACSASSPRSASSPAAARTPRSSRASNASASASARRRSR